MPGLQGLGPRDPLGRARPPRLSSCGARLQRASVCSLVARAWVGGVGGSLDLGRARATLAPGPVGPSGHEAWMGTDSCWGAGPGRGYGQPGPHCSPGPAPSGPLRWGRGQQPGRWPGGGSGPRPPGHCLGPSAAPASFQGWSSFATGASKFASAAKEGVSSLPRRATRPTGPSPAGRPGLWEMGRVWGRGASPHAQARAPPAPGGSPSQSSRGRGEPSRPHELCADRVLVRVSPRSWQRPRWL